jgi:hypothetical protein
MRHRWCAAAAGWPGPGLSDQNSAQEDGSDEAQRSQCAIEMPQHRRYSDKQIHFQSANAALRALFRKLKRRSMIVPMNGG